MTGALHVWHLTEDAPRRPLRVSAGERVHLGVGTWPITPGQSVWITWRAQGAVAEIEERADAVWERNENNNSFWSATIGPFASGETVEYRVHAEDGAERISGPVYSFSIGPKLHLALLWHQHQPMYRVAAARDDRPTLQQPWVRLHALRDYYSMPALVAEYPDVHVTFNLTPVLLSQIDDYLERSATDRHLELTLLPVERMTRAAREELLGTFFDADWHRQIFAHPRYRELFDKRARGDDFTLRDIQDLQMWSNLAWFGKEFRDGSVELVTGEVVGVHRFVEKTEGFSLADVRAMVDEQFKVLRAVMPIHRMLQERGQIEVSTTPLCHPILPLLIDTDKATIDLDGATLPRRFAYPEDANAQVRRAAFDYERRFDKAPDGMWPAEGAVSRSAVPIFARHGVRWIASDRGVLERSGRWGYRAEEPDVLCRPYLVREGESEVAIFFRDTALSDAIGFRYQHLAADDAAEQFVRELDARFVRHLAHDEDRVVSVILDGENAWGGYVEDGRPFLRALYARLAGTPSIQTVTMSEYLRGNQARSLRPHSPTTELHELFTGSWIDEARSRPGVDLGTWIGEPAENRAWELLADARRAIEDAPRERRGPALESAYVAEGSDWLWWFGDDQDSGNDEVFDELFRAHVRGVYQELGLEVPLQVAVPLVTRHVVWTFARPVSTVAPGDHLIVRTNCPGTLRWRADDLPERTVELEPVGGVLAGSRRFQASLGRIDPGVAGIRFRFLCGECGCARHDTCCRAELQTVQVDTRLAPAAETERTLAVHG